MSAKLETLDRRFEDMEQQLASPNVLSDQKRYSKLTKAHADLKEVVDVFRRYRDVQAELAQSRALLQDADADIRFMAQEEIKTLEPKTKALEHELIVLLLPKDPLDDKNIILEIRAGTGGEEAALFAADLFRMYSRYAEAHGWKVEIMGVSDAAAGGYKEISALAYEAIRSAARIKNPLVGSILRGPGLLLQTMTTREPDEEQVEVGLVALREALGTSATAEIVTPTYERLDPTKGPILGQEQA